MNTIYPPKHTHTHTHTRAHKCWKKEYAEDVHNAIDVRIIVISHTIPVETLIVVGFGNQLSWKKTIFGFFFSDGTKRVVLMFCVQHSFSLLNIQSDGNKYLPKSTMPGELSNIQLAYSEIKIFCSEQ